MREIKRLDALELWGRAGKLAPRASAAIVLASTISFVIALVGPRLVWNLDRYYAAHRDSFWFCNAMALAFLASTACVLVPWGRLSSLLRLAVFLPVSHAALMVWAWIAVASFDHESWWRSWWARDTPLVNTFPISIVLAGAAGMSLTIAWLAAHRHRGERLRALVTFALVHLLVFGLWLPLAAQLVTNVAWAQTIGDYYYGPARAQFTVVVVPPIILAGAFTVLAIRRPDVVHRLRTGGLAFVGVVVVFASVTGIAGATETGGGVSTNFIHVEFALAFVAIASLLALGVAKWRRHRARGSSFTGVIAGDDVVGAFEVSSWLRGPRAVLQPFVLATSSGDIPIDRGARLVDRLPPETSALQPGGAFAALRGGDRVIVSGFVDQTDGEHPFRATTVPVVGPRGLVVSPIDKSSGFTSALLALWRPCLAYLIIATTIAIPALVAALAPVK